METAEPDRIIPVKNRHQAKEWSLVLISQGIESAVIRDDSSGAWLLSIGPEHAERAFRVLRQYKVENRNWGWQRNVPGLNLDIHWGSLFFCGFLAIVHFLSTLPNSTLYESGILNKTEVLSSGEWWRLVTAMTLHGDGAHLAMNLIFGFLLIGLTMGRYGSGMGLLAVLGGGVLGNVLGLMVYPEPYRSLGASGAVLAGLGVLTAAGIHEVFQHRATPQRILGIVGAGVMLFLMNGANPDSDLVVHLGGFLGGLLTGGLLEAGHRYWLRHRFWNGIAWMVVAGGLLIAWTLASIR